jgi:hypothetical protein
MVIELVQRQPGVAPKHALVVRNGWMVAQPTDALIEEPEENGFVSPILLEELVNIKQLASKHL